MLGFSTYLQRYLDKVGGRTTFKHRPVLKVNSDVPAVVFVRYDVSRYVLVKLDFQVGFVGSGKGQRRG